MQPRHLSALTALRFPAALAVFGWHVLATVDSGLGPVRWVLRAGPLGVCFFYILSGFVLTWSARDRDSRRSFYWRRVARILPTYYATIGLALVLIGAGVVYDRPLGPDFLAPVLLLVQAWIPDAAHFFAINPPAWSLSCEAFFYALFPFLILMVRPLTPRQAMVGIGTLVALVTLIDVTCWAAAGTVQIQQQNSTLYWLAYICPATRLLEFVAGMLLAEMIRAGRRAPVSFPIAAVLAAGAYLTAGALPTALAATFVVVVPFLLLIAAAATSGVSVPSVLLRLGEWSFAFYLVHQLVITSASHRLGLAPKPAAAVLLALSVAAAGILHLLIERPAEQYIRGRFAHSRDRLTAAVS